MAPCKKNDIISIKEKSNDNTSELYAFVACSFQILLYFIDVNTKKGKGKGTDFLKHDSTFNTFRPPFVGLEPGNDNLIEVDHNNPQFRRDYDLFKPLLKHMSEDRVEIFSKVHKTT